MESMDMFDAKYLYDRLQVLEAQDKPLTETERLKAMNGPLLHWYKNNARILPWRENPLPYRVWISEIMLQQTRVEAVKPYFERFMAALQDVRALAEVPEEQLLKLWEGLGYYNRARNLKKAAGLIVSQYDGVIPSGYEELLKLPGIGSYTAGAIASIAYGKPYPAVDGNVLRVLSRVTASRDDILRQAVKKRFEQELIKTMPREEAGAFNQGLIEIGAIVCVPNGTPRCGSCPLVSICLAHREELTGEIPFKAKKKPRRIEERTVLVIERAGKVAIRKREDTGLLASLYELPSLDGRVDSETALRALSLRRDDVAGIELLPAAKHIFSHVEWHMSGIRLRLRREAPDVFLMVEKTALAERYPLPNAFAAYRKLL